MEVTSSWLVVLVAFTSTFAIASCLIMFKFYRKTNTHNEEEKRMSPSGHDENRNIRTKLAQTVFVLTFVGYIATALGAVDYYTKCWQCDKVPFDNAVYTVQCHALTYFWFNRVHGSFKDSAFALSTLTVKAMYVWISLSALSSTIVALLPYHPLHAILLVNYGLLTLSTSSIFVSKLIRVYKDLQSSSDIVHLITKIVILNMVSVCWVIFDVVMHWKYWRWFDWKPNSIGGYMVYYTATLTYFINLLCVTLSYAFFSGHYDAICGLVHTKCHCCWDSCIKSQSQRTNKVRGICSVSCSSPTGTSTSTEAAI